MMYASLRAEPNFRYVFLNVQLLPFLATAHYLPFLSVLGKRLGKDMGKVSNGVKKMTQEQVLAFEQTGEISFFGHCLKLDDIKVTLHASSLRLLVLGREWLIAVVN
jgi:isoleucyl-tRNA synthetase